MLFVFVVTFIFQLNSYDVFFPYRSYGEAVAANVIPPPPVCAFVFLGIIYIQKFSPFALLNDLHLIIIEVTLLGF